MIIPASADEVTPGTVDSQATTMFTISSSSSTSLQPVVTATGKYSLSVDGLGYYSYLPGTIQVEKPAGATVKSAYFAAADVWRSGQIPDGAITIDGQGVNWDLIVSGMANNHWADVTGLVKPKIDAASPGRIDFTVVENYDADGVILIVIFEDPNASVSTIVLMFGSQSTTGDTFQVLLAEPIDKSNPDLDLIMGLGISFSYQNYAAQYSIIDVNGKRLTSAAGGEDDGYSGNGGLITVGGLDDSTANPADPYQTAYSSPFLDDELYNILPFVNNSDNSITVFTQNPSNDDNIFFAYFHLKSVVAVVGEGIVLSPVSATNDVGTSHTVTATVQDNTGNPIVGTLVTFEVISGPNAGVVGSSTITDSNGQASMTYYGHTEGTDTIVASFVNSQQVKVYSNEATKKWVTDTTTPPTPTIVLSPASATNNVGTSHTVTATVRDSAGSPVVGTWVSIDVISGPNSGGGDSGMTDSNGQFSLTYTGSSAGTDTLVASFVNSQQVIVYSNEATKTWITGTPTNEIPEFPTLVLPITAILGLAFVLGRKKEE